MHFLFVSAQYLPTTGGVERYTQNLAAELIKMGHRATVITSALPNLPECEISEDGIKIFRLPSYLFIHGRFPVPKKGKYFNKLALSIFETPFDFAVINTRFYLLSLWAAKTCHKRKIPSVIIEHGTKHLSMDSKILDFFGNLYEHGAMKIIRRYCNNFYGVSKAGANWLQHFHISARGVLYNAVDADKLAETAARSQKKMQKQLEIPEGAPVIVFVGRFIVEKGIRELLEAFSLLRQKSPECVLVMAGEGPLFDFVKEQKIKNLKLTGSLPHHEILGLMACSDIFCLPTWSEGFSSTILEAAALGCCIVTTPTGGSPELIIDGESGVLLSNRSPQTIADALFRTLEDESFRIIAGTKVSEKVRSCFTWEKTASDLLKIASEQCALDCRPKDFR